MKVRFWGVRGSIPSPLRPSEIKEKICQAILGLPDINIRDQAAVRAYVDQLPPLLGGTVGGNTPCVEIRSGNDVIALDAGSGLYQMGHALMRGAFGQGQGTLHLLISHTHWDHIQGLTMFSPIFKRGNRILIYSIHDVRAALELQHHARNWPVSLDMMRASLEFIPLQLGAPFTIGQIQVDTFKNNHPGDSCSYRFQDQHAVLVYTTDSEYKDLDSASVQPYIDFIRNADALIFDSQYTLRGALEKIDWGHSSAMIGIDLARAGNVKRLFLFHHDPTYSDAEVEQILRDANAYRDQAPGRPPYEVRAAREEMEIDLTPERAIGLEMAPDGETPIFTPPPIFDEPDVETLMLRLGGSAELAQRSILDLSIVETLTTSGLKALVTLQAQQNMPLVLVASEKVREIIRLAGYQDFFAIYPSVQAALAAVEAREAAQLPGQVINNRYQIQERLGESSLGTVLKALDLQDNCFVAVKILSPIFSPETLERLKQQANQIINLEHRNIVKLFAWGDDEMAPYEVEELMQAPTLEEILLTGEPLPPEQALEIAHDISQALEYAHARGVIHGDLKPANVFLTPQGAKLSGFGLGRLLEGRDLLNIPFLFLSPAYLAPEQIHGNPLDARIDLYALGVIMYQLLTGRLPFTGEVRDVLLSHMHAVPRPPRELNPHIAPSLEHLILRLLAKNPNERYTPPPQSQYIWGLQAKEMVPPRRRLVGREAQIQILSEYWEKARLGQGQLVLIAGELGIGKTTLAQQAAAQSGAQVVLIGYGDEREGCPAYYLFTQVLKSYLAMVPPEVVDTHLQQILSNFGYLLPEIRQMLPDLPTPPTLQPAQEQLRLMENIAHFIQQATRTRPWFLILDDLQWADKNSLELLRYLGRHLPLAPLLIVGTYHDTDLAPGHPLLETLRTLNREPTYCHLRLERLDAAQVGQMLANIWQQPVPADLVAKIYQHTGGNPFYVEEVARALVEERRVTLEGGQWKFPDLETISLPSSVREVVLRRVGFLPPDTQSLLRQAAVLGRTFYFQDLCEMSGLSEWETLEHLDLALERQLVQELHGEAQLRFRHPEIHLVLYAELGALRRRLLHRQAGEILERRASAEKDSRLEELAYHFEQAGEYSKAAAYSLQIGQKAQSAYASDAAIKWYNQTLAILEKINPEQRAGLAELEISAHRALSQVLRITGYYEQAQRHCEAAWALLTARPASPELARQRADICYQMARIYEALSEYATAAEWVNQGLSYLDKNEPSPELARLYNLSGWVYMRQGRYQDARQRLEQALTIAQATHLRQIEADSVRSLGVMAWQSNAIEEATAYFEWALNIYREIGDRQGAGWSLNNMGVAAISIGQYARARGYYEQALQIYNQIGDRAGTATTLHNLGIVARNEGDYAQAQSFAEQALRLRREIGHRRGEATTLDNLGLITMLYGAYPQAREHFERALAIRQEIGDRLGEGETHSCLGTLHHYMGDNETARKHSQQGLDIARQVGNQFDQAIALVSLGHALAALGHTPEALAAYQQALTLKIESRDPTPRLRALAGLAQITLAQHADSQALSYAEEILRHLESHKPVSVDEPFQIHLVCYRVLRALQDPRAPDILSAAYNQLQAWAARMTDEVMRRSFLENVAAHREIVQTFQVNH